MGIIRTFGLTTLQISWLRGKRASRGSPSFCSAMCRMSFAVSSGSRSSSITSKMSASSASADNYRTQEREGKWPPPGPKRVELLTDRSGMKSAFIGKRGLARVPHGLSHTNPARVSTG